MLRCFSSLGCPEFSLAEVLALATSHHIPAVELRALGGGTDLPAHFTALFGSPAAFADRRQSQPAGVRIAALNASLHLVGATPADRDQLLALAAWAEAMGIAWLRVFDGGRTASDAEITEAGSTLRWWRELRHRHGWKVDLMVETHDALVTAALIQRFVAAAPGTKILWDAHHTWRKGREDPLVTWPAIRAHVVHVHVKDSIGEPSARHPFTYVLPGDGEFPQTALRARLRSDGYAGYVSLEWERLWHPYLPPLAEALQVAEARGWW